MLCAGGSLRGYVSLRNNLGHLGHLGHVRIFPGVRAVLGWS